MADISNITTVSLLSGGTLAVTDNMNNCCIITSQQDGAVNSANRYAYYRNSADVATDFGTASDIYQYALTFFGKTPNPVTAGGNLIVGYWRGATEATAATAAVLEGAEIVAADVVSLLQDVDDGSFVISVDGASQTVDELDFRMVLDIDDVIDVIDGVITGATPSYSSSTGKISITSDTTGATSLITLASVAAIGTPIESILGLNSGSGAVATQGAAIGSLDAETKVQCVTILKAATNAKGMVFIDTISDADHALLAAWSQANSTMMYTVVSGSAYLVNDIDTNVVVSNRASGYTNYRMIYRADANRKAAAAYMSRMHTVNFEAKDSMLTMQAKEIAVPYEDLNQTTITAAYNVGLDVYVPIKDVPVILTSYVNDFADNRYGLIWLVDAVQTAMFNLIKGTATKIPLTEKGRQLEIGTVEKIMRKAVKCGLAAPGEWLGPDYIGTDVEIFKEAIRQNGFYVTAGSLVDLSLEDRQLRKMFPIQAAFKMSGAGHSVYNIINFEV